MEDEIKVSVMILAYNHEKYIAQTIESVLAQKVSFNIEILISDDASTDRTSDIILSYCGEQNTNIKVIKQEENKGPTFCGYEMLKQCRGQYLACCEGDDYWCDENKLQIQADFLDNHSEYSAVTHDIKTVDDDCCPLRKQKISWISRKRDYSIKDFKGIFLPGHTSSMMRRNYLLDTSFDFSVLYKASRYVGDRTVALVWACKGLIFRMPRIMSCHRCRDDGNITSDVYKNNINHIDDDFKYTLALEKYASDELGADVNFDYHKFELFCGAIISMLKNKTDNSKKTLFNILNSFNAFRKKVYCFTLLPYFIIRKIIIKKFYVN